MAGMMIDRYVNEVVARLPILKRKKAAAFLKKRIYASLNRYTGGEEPTNQDVRVILKALGTPKEVAEGYFEEQRVKMRKEKPDRETVLGVSLNVLFLVSVVLVLVGLIGLALGFFETGMPVFLGAAISVGIMAAANIVPLYREEDRMVRSKGR